MCFWLIALPLSLFHVSESASFLPNLSVFLAKFLAAVVEPTSRPSDLERGAQIIPGEGGRREIWKRKRRGEKAEEPKVGVRNVSTRV